LLHLSPLRTLVVMYANQHASSYVTSRLTKLTGTYCHTYHIHAAGIEPRTRFSCAVEPGFAKVVACFISSTILKTRWFVEASSKSTEVAKAWRFAQSCDRGVR
jgi:hypothetical protein